jgi:hypothetical protein
MKFLPGLKKLTHSNKQKLTPDGFMEAFERNWLGETVGEKSNGDPEVSGWLLGDLCIEVKDIQGNLAHIELSVKQPGTGKKMAVIHDAWFEVGPSITFKNPPEGAVVVGQRVKTGIGK